ncbi:MAG TPA: hypothetical protein VLE97_11485 [Gaiellaceae bacterium]|nr:hypothetical protein [Gaiellaceae bacterium]
MAPPPPTIDLDVLCARVRAALPQLACEMVYLEHSETRERVSALSIETEERAKDHVYRMTIAPIGGAVHFFVHIYGTSRDLTTQGAQRFKKECSDVDEVFAIVHSCWTGAQPS